MARSVNLEDVIESLFFDSSSNSQIDRRYWGLNNSIPTTMMRYMEVPLDKDVFELPLFAFSAFKEMHKANIEGDVLTAQLFSCGVSSSYKSLDAIMKDCLSTNFSRHLIQIQLSGTASIYYATFGAVFSEDFEPLMMLSWIMERKTDDEGKVVYHYKRPLLRLKPEICVSKEDSIQRFLSGKMMVAGLNSIIHTPYFYDCHAFLEQGNPYSSGSIHHLKVEIDQSPFIIRDSDTPSVSVTNEDLLQLVADHIDEVIQ